MAALDLLADGDPGMERARADRRHRRAAPCSSPTLAAVIVAANLRLHLWFTSRFYPGELQWLRARVARWIHGADWLFALSLVAGALLVGDEGSAVAILLLAFGIGAAVAFLVIEPATTRAAFRSSSK